ncbi:unnamed protein product [Paramecium octaurelia]|uniref:Transmembrane protein n=1 Tax=Paramecium octaurelia TaxID=43137 RepID=A0A8S1X2X7_PAROT|nr:unnamed protein product [Paramecium octaurelia]
MKFQHFWLLIAILKECLCNITISQTQKFNYPLEIRNSNTIFLRDYTLEIVEAPFYSLLSSSEFNLKIDQAISQIRKMSSSTINDSSIRIGSNYVALFGDNSNNFWVLTYDEKLYQGLVKSNGEIQMTFLDITIQKYFFQINLITNEFGMLSSFQEGELFFSLLNSTSLECTDIVLNYPIKSEIYNPIVQILTVNPENFTFCLTYTTEKDAHIVYFTYNQNDIELLSEQIFQGNYQNAVLSSNSNFLFLISKERVDLVDLNNNTGIQEIININIQSQDDLQAISYFTNYQISNNLFHIVFLQQQKLTSFFIDVNYINQQVQSISYFINEYTQIINLKLTLDNIFIITDSFIIGLQLKDSIKATCYQQLNEGTFAFFYLLRNIIVVQDSVDNQIVISTYLINDPQIFISQKLTQQIDALVMPVKLDILVVSQVNQKLIQYAFQIQLIQLDVIENQMPIQFHQYIDEMVLKFPEVMIKDRSQTFLGPNLTLSILSNNSDYLLASVEGTMFGEYNIYTAIYSIACSFSSQEQLYCTQYKNDTIILTIDNAAISLAKYPIRATEKLVKCSCMKTVSNLNVLMQFDQSIIIQQFNYSLHPKELLTIPFLIKVVDAAILKDVLFTTTIDGILTATDISEQQVLFTIPNNNFNEIYVNSIDFPHFLFVNNVVELTIIAYNGKQSYEFINYIPYPIQNYTSNAIGILNNGIYLAFSNDDKSFIYFYQKINIWLQTNNQNYFDVYIEQFKIQKNPKILSTYTTNNFYLIFQKGQYTQLAQFSGTGTSYTALRTSKQIRVPNLHFTQMSAIFQQERNYEVQIVYLFTNSAQSYNHPYLSYDFMLTTRYNEADYIGQCDLKYKAHNQNFTSYYHQKVSIIYENYLLLPKNSNNKQAYFIQDQGNVNINPRTLFYGNIQNYKVDCDVCNSIKITQPIDFSNSYSLNISVENVLNQDGLIYLTDDQYSLYLFYPETNELTMIYDFSQHVQIYCSALFIEMITSFPVQICSQSSIITIYAYNTTSNQLISHILNEVCCYAESSYKNGILTIFNFGSFQGFDFFAFYFWISENKIHLNQAFKEAGVCHYCFANPLYLSMSENFTTQPCQIFGLITTQSNGQGDNEIFLLKNCIPSSISENFGFAPNDTTPSGNIYFQQSTWRLVESDAVRYSFYYITNQFGSSSQQISDNILKAEFLVTYFYVVELYSLLFNEETGTLLSFVLDQSFFLDYNKTVSIYSVRQGSNGLLMIESFQEDEIFTPQIYTYDKQKLELKQNNKQINRMIGFEIINAKPSKKQSKLSGNYYAFKMKNTSQLYYVQNYLTLSIDLIGIQNASIEITGQNIQNSVTQSIFIQNLNYNNHNNDTNINNNTNDTPDTPDDQNSTNSDKDKTSQHITIIILYCFMIVFLFIVLLAPRCCFKLNRVQKNTSFNFELTQK